MQRERSHEQAVSGFGQLGSALARRLSRRQWLAGFGVACSGLVAASKGLNATGGPKGVGAAVNQSVVISFMLLFLTNFIITAIYVQVVPQKGG